jgi:hypothetical protein
MMSDAVGVWMGLELAFQVRRLAHLGATAHQRAVVRLVAVAIPSGIREHVGAPQRVE